MNIAEIRQKYPQYNDMSDEALAQALHAKHYSDMPFAEFAGKIGLGAKPEPKREQRTVPQELARQGGLTARYAAEGVAALPGIVLDPINRLFGLKPFSEAVSSLGDRAGLPRPETGAENLSGAVSKAVAGGGLVGRIAQAGNQAIPMVRQIASAPATEMATSGIGGGASELTRQAGGGDIAQMIAGAVAPLPVSAAVAGAKSATRAANELRRPLTHGGAEQIAADTLGRLTQDKTRALQNLEHYANVRGLERKTGQHVMGVPGAKPTAGAVSADYGLIGGQQAISRGDAAPRFALQQAENNQARLADLAKLNATEEQLAKFVAKRDQVTKPLRDEAFSKSTGPVDYGRVEDAINRLRKSAAGGKQETARGLDTLHAWIKQRQAEGRYAPEDAYALHQDINDLIRGKIQDDKGAIRLAGGMATVVKQELANAIEDVAPGFRKYLNTYSRLSRPIERLEAITERLGGRDLDKVTTALPQATPDGAAFTLSQAKLRNAVNNLRDEVPLAPRQRDVLERVLGDLNAETLAARGGKQPGSDTYQNMASANLVNRVLGRSIAESGVGKAVQAPFNLAMRPFEARIQDLIVEAYQDPELMARLLKMARTSRDSPTLAGLLGHGASKSTEGLLGSLLAQ